MKKDSITEVTPEIIEGWKAVYGEGNVLEVSVAEETISLDPHLMVAELEDQPRAVAYIKRPDNKVLNFAMQQLPKMLDAGKVIIKNCWLGGDDRLRHEDSYANAAALQVIELIQIRQGKLKKI